MVVVRCAVCRRELPKEARWRPGLGGLRLGLPLARRAGDWDLVRRVALTSGLGRCGGECARGERVGKPGGVVGALEGGSYGWAGEHVSGPNRGAVGGVDDDGMAWLGVWEGG